MEEIKEEEVQRREGAEDSAGHDQEQDIELLLALLDFPRYASRGERDDCGHQYQADVDAIDADVITDAKSTNPGMLLYKLIIRDSGLKLQKHFYRENGREECGEDRHSAHHGAESAGHEC